ncbi:hypothetical protein PTKIN_Ptkin05aG0012700 [Pterospermum kingtungense]
MSTDDLLQNFVEYNEIRALRVAFLLIIFITLFLALIFLLCEIFIWTISLRSPDIARIRTTSDPETGTEDFYDGEIIMENGVGNESFPLLRIHDALGALRSRNQQQQQQQQHHHHQQQQQQPGNDKRKGVLRVLPKPECYGSRYQRIMNNTAEECVICLEEFVKGDVCRILPSCNHIFHLGCIDKWLLNHQLTCPICRSSPMNA